MLRFVHSCCASADSCGWPYPRWDALQYLHGILLDGMHVHEYAGLMRAVKGTRGAPQEIISGAVS